MKKYLQNRIAESSLTLPALALYAFAVWLLAGCYVQGWWGQLVILGISVYLMMELSNSNALMRVRSRMVSSVFLSLSCVTVAQFGSWAVAIVTLCFILTILVLFQSYQDSSAVGKAFYSFLFLGVSSLAFVEELLYVPLLWILMGTHLQMLSFRTWWSSFLGLLTPYWLVLPVLFYKGEHPVTLAMAHFERLIDLVKLNSHTNYDYLQTANLAFVILLLLVGIVHFWRNSIDEKIRNRQFFGFFTAITLITSLFLVLQPDSYSPLLHHLLVCSSPLIAHFFVHTHTRFTNIFFVFAVTACLLLTLVNLFPALFCNLFSQLLSLWNGSLIF